MLSAGYTGFSTTLTDVTIAVWNIWMTIRQAPEAHLSRDRPTTPEGEAGERGVPAE